MDRLTRELYGSGEPTLQWAGSDPEVPLREVVDAVLKVAGHMIDVTELEYLTSDEAGRRVARYVAWLCACPAASEVTIDGYHDPDESGVFVTSRYEGDLQSLGPCVLKTQALSHEQRIGAFLLPSGVR